MMPAPAAIGFDVDGTLLNGSRPRPGALRTVRDVAAELPVFYLTNGSACTREQVESRLRRAGFAAEKSDVYTSASVTAGWLIARGVEAVAVVGSEALAAEVLATGLTVVSQREAFHALVVGLAPGHDLSDPCPLEEPAVTRLAAGALLVACNRDDSYPGDGGRLMPGLGRVVARIEAQCGRPVDAAPGKPEPDMLRQAAAEHGVHETDCLVVGDSVTSDVTMAQRAGALWALVPDPVSGLPQRVDVDAAADPRGRVLADLHDLAALVGGSAR